MAVGREWRSRTLLRSTIDGWPAFSKQRVASPGSCRQDSIGDARDRTFPMRDPYAVLGVARDASEDDIKKAYRRLAKKLHPDLSPGNRLNEQQFKEVTAAYDLLSDPQKRGRYDRGEIDATGRERGFQAHGGGRPQYHTGSAGAGASF